MISSELLLEKHSYSPMFTFSSKMFKIEEYYLENTRHLLIYIKILSKFCDSDRDDKE